MAASRCTAALAPPARTAAGIVAEWLGAQGLSVPARRHQVEVSGGTLRRAMARRRAGLNGLLRLELVRVIG